MDKETKKEFEKLTKFVQEGFVAQEKSTDNKFATQEKRMQGGFLIQAKRTDDKIEKLARMMQKSFDATAQKTDVDKRFDQVDKRLNKIDATMVTKDYLSDKLADLRGDLVMITRKEDKKLQTLVGVLLKRKVISEAESKSIFSLEPFPQLFI
ncbi:MAG: hypothetical protein Q7R75_02150 [bacterium]|nr:hypothetical protein [bacterium]